MDKGGARDESVMRARGAPRDAPPSIIRTPPDSPAAAAALAAAAAAGVSAAAASHRARERESEREPESEREERERESREGGGAKGERHLQPYLPKSSAPTSCSRRHARRRGRLSLQRPTRRPPASPPQPRASCAPARCRSPSARGPGATDLNEGAGENQRGRESRV